jgi:hypothetical protein
LVEAAKGGIKEQNELKGCTASSREKPETQILYFAEFWLLL